MQRHGQAVFLIEQLQPSWLPRQWEVSVYAFATRFLDCFLSMLGVCCLLLAWKSPTITDLDARSVGVCLLIIPSFVAASLLLADRKFLRSAAGHIRQPLKGYILLAFRRTIRIIIFTSLTALLCFETSRQMFGPAGGRFMIWVWGAPVVFGLVRGSLRRDSLRTGASDISAIERVSWSWRGALAGLAAAIIYYPIDQLFSNWEKVSCCGCFLLIFLLPLAPLANGVFFLLPLLGAFRVVLLEDDVFPNAGTRISLATAMDVSLKVAIAAGIVFFWFLWLAGFKSPPTTLLLSAFLFGLGYGILSGAWYGGVDVLRHYILRFLLSRRGYLPWGQEVFLDFCVDELHILQRVGGGYMFLHRYLLEYFAGLGEGTEGMPATTLESPGAVAS